MVIGLLTVELHIPESNSLKAKRRVIKSLKDKLRNKFNASVAEIDHHDKWQLATLAICAVSNDKVYIDGALNKALNFIGELSGADITDYQIELL
ncbi:MAG: DUF503 domain-containing protein [Candidatus Omnitrophica bacterium]|nr:DUF503 domain-containing protein [Candidatus Omnitrophota bacterium]